MTDEQWKKASRLAAEKLIQQGREEVAMEILRILSSWKTADTNTDLIDILEQVFEYVKNITPSSKEPPM